VWVDLLSPMTSTEGTAETVGEDGLLVAAALIRR